MLFSRTDPKQLGDRLRLYGLHAQKGLGQHFLVDERVLDTIIQAAAIPKDITVVEIGPGPGALTERLLKVTDKLIAFEFDPGMARLLREDFKELEIQEGNILETAPIKLKNIKNYQVVANVPYNITNPLLRLFLESNQVPRPDSLVLMLQQEVAERLAAKPGKPGRGYLSVLTQYFAEVEYICTVPSSSFWPAPKVTSAVIKLITRTLRELPEQEEVDFLRFVRRLSIQPRKQLKNVLAGILGVPTAKIERYFTDLGLQKAVRAQELGQREWILLYQNQGAV